MSAPLIPSPLDQLRWRPFSFYPAIKSAGPNEWLFSVVAWSEIQIVNCRTGRAIWIPQRYIGAVTERAGSIPAVHVTKELEYRANALWPRVKRVIEIPVSADRSTGTPSPRPDASQSPAPVIEIRLQNRAVLRISKLLAAVASVGALILSLLPALLSVFAKV